MSRASLMNGLMLAGAGLLMLAVPAQAVTMQECSAKYGAAKSAGTLGNQSWNDFRKNQCGAGDSVAKFSETRSAETKPDEIKLAQAKSDTKSDAKSEVKSDTSDAKPAKRARSKKSDTKEAAAPSGPAVFPSAISPKYAKEKESKQRQKTCLDLYNANKASGGNGGLKWIQKGGGYYSECNKKLKA